MQTESRPPFRGALSLEIERRYEASPVTIGAPYPVPEPRVPRKASTPQGTRYVGRLQPEGKMP